MIGLLVAFVIPTAPAPGDDAARLALSLTGSPCYRCREDGERRLIRIVSGDRRLGRFVRQGIDGPDVERALRCSRVARQLARCQTCKGDGYVPRKLWPEAESWGIVHDACGTCGCTGFDLVRAPWLSGLKIPKMRHPNDWSVQ